MKKDTLKFMNYNDFINFTDYENLLLKDEHKIFIDTWFDNILVTEEEILDALRNNEQYKFAPVYLVLRENVAPTKKYIPYSERDQILITMIHKYKDLYGENMNLFRLAVHILDESKLNEYYDKIMIF